jgi:hypothetical protein
VVAVEIADRDRVRRISNRHGRARRGREATRTVAEQYRYVVGALVRESKVEVAVAIEVADRH